MIVKYHCRRPTSEKHHEALSQTYLQSDSGLEIIFPKWRVSLEDINIVYKAS